MFPGRTVGSAQKVAISGEGQPGDDNSRDDCCEIPFAAGTQGFLMRLSLLRPSDAPLVHGSGGPRRVGDVQIFLRVADDPPGYTGFRHGGFTYRIGLTLMRAGAGPMPALPIGLRRSEEQVDPETRIEANYVRASLLLFC